MKCKHNVIEVLGRNSVEWCATCGAIREIGMFAKTLKNGSRRMVQKTSWKYPEGNKEACPIDFLKAYETIASGIKSGGITRSRWCKLFNLYGEEYVNKSHKEE